MDYVDMTPYKTPRKMMKKDNTDGEESELSTARGIKTRNYQKTSGHKTRGEQSTQPQTTYKSDIKYVGIREIINPSDIKHLKINKHNTSCAFGPNLDSFYGLYAS